MKLIPTILTCFVLLAGLKSNAQFNTSVYGTAIVPVGEAAEYISTTYGPGIEVGYRVNDNINITAGGCYFKTSATYDIFEGDYILSPWSINAYFNAVSNNWEPFVAIGPSAFWTEIHATVERDIKIDTEDWFFGFSGKLGSAYNFNEKLKVLGFIDIGTFYLRDTHNIKFFKNAIIDEDIKNSVFPNSTTFASLNLGLNYSF